MAMTMRASLAGTRVAAAPQKTAVRARATAPVADVRDNIVRFGKVAAATGVSLALALSANAANVKLGKDGGALVFDPANITIKAGETVTWTNNVGFPHNVVFDEDEVPAGVNAESLSHEDYLNGAGESVSTKFTKAGTYKYYCEPHQGAGMVGTITVQ